MQYTISYEENSQHEDLQIIENGIMEYAKQKKNLNPVAPFAFFIRDEERNIVGGCSGETLYGHLFIGQLWVSEPLRGKGHGTSLIQSAENLALERDCHFMAVNTMDWEALDFYKKLGFYVEFERHGFEKNSIFYYLRKDLGAADS